MEYEVSVGVFFAAVLWGHTLNVLYKQISYTENEMWS